MQLDETLKMRECWIHAQLNICRTFLIVMAHAHRNPFAFAFAFALPFAIAFATPPTSAEI
jgi:hypothetical protein